MEENKNNAMEKVENIINGSSPTLDAQKRAENIKSKQEKQRFRMEKSIEKSRKKAERKAYKQREKSAKKRYRARKNAEIKAKRAEDRDIRRQSKKGFSSLKIATISLAVSTLILATVLLLTNIIPSSTEKGLENVYRRAYFGAVEQVDSIDANLSKALATKDENTMSLYLVDTAINSELCENDIGELPLQDENKFYTTKLINQIGDYSKYLNKKIMNGEHVSSAERQTLRKLYYANRELRSALQEMTDSMGSDFSFLSLANGDKGNALLTRFNELQNLSSQYPELIYDGPFSDGLDNREVKGLTGNDITKQQAEEIFNGIFSPRGVVNVKSMGETNGVIECYNVQGDVKGDPLYAQITKKGGKLLMFAFAGSCREINYSKDSAISNAKTFLGDLGIGDMEAVWINLANNVYTINFAYKTQGAVVYSDLIKVRVCAETGGVIGFEATTYYTNHTERNIESPKISVESAKEKVLDEIEIATSRLAVVPIGQKSEKLCYEFSGEMDGETYYVYIDAITGRQVEMFKVIESTEGTLLI